MRISAIMRDLHYDRAAACVDGIHDGAPAGNLFGGVDARRIRETLRLRAHRGSFSDNHPGGGTLCVIFSVERRRSMAHARPHARHRCHDDAVTKRDRTEPQWFEKNLDRHLIASFGVFAS